VTQRAQQIFDAIASANGDCSDQIFVSFFVEYNRR